MVRATHARSVLAGVLCVLICARAAGAQQVSSLDELGILRSTNARVTVTDGSGREFRGTVADASEAALSLRIDGAVHRFAVDEVRSVRVRQEDPLANGALMGTAVAAGLTSLIFLDNECRDDPGCYAAVAVYGGVGALAGLGIDALLHREAVVYAGPAPRIQSRLTAAPFVAPGRRGIRLSVVF